VHKLGSEIVGSPAVSRASHGEHETFRWKGKNVFWKSRFVTLNCPPQLVTLI